jgi:dCTP deaminase
LGALPTATDALRSEETKMILSGQQIESRIDDDIIIDPYDSKQLNPNSINLTLHNELMTYEEVVLDMRKANRVLGS